MIKKLQIVAPLLLLLWVSQYRLSLPLTESNTPSLGTRAELSATAVQANFTEADFARHLEQLKKKLPSSDFTIVIQPPFVVIGDESPESVKEDSERTVKRS